MNKIRILLIEDNRLLRESIAARFKKQPDMNVVATVGNSENILELIDRLKPGIMLLDLGLRSQNGLNIVKLVKKDYPDVKIILMDIFPLQADVFEFVQAGVSAFTLNDINGSELLKTIRSVHKGAQVLPPHLNNPLFSQIVEHAVNGSKPTILEESVRMTTRERQVSQFIADGFTNKEIAQKLELSIYTVKSHVHNILEKLSLSTRAQIAKYVHLSEEYKTSPTPLYNNISRVIPRSVDRPYV